MSDVFDRLIERKKNGDIFDRVLKKKNEPRKEDVFDRAMKEIPSLVKSYIKANQSKPQPSITISDILSVVKDELSKSKVEPQKIVEKIIEKEIRTVVKEVEPKNDHASQLEDLQGKVSGLNKSLKERPSDVVIVNSPLPNWNGQEGKTLISRGGKLVWEESTATALEITKASVGLANVDNTSDASKPVSTAQQAAFDLKANLASPTFSGTVGGITKSMIGLGNVDNTSDASKPISSAVQSALDLKANVIGVIPDGDKGDITVATLGTVWTIDNSVVTNAKMANMTTKTYKGRTAGTTGAPEDVAVATLKTDLSLVKADVGLGNVDNTSDASKPVSSATQTALDGKQPLDADLTTIAGLTATTDNFMVAASNAWASRTPAQAKTSLALVKGDVGLGSVDNTADTAKPVSTAQQTAFDLKANLASPAFSGTPSLPTGTTVVTQAAGDSSTKPASTAFVAAAVPNSSYRTILDSSGSHTAARTAATYGLGQGDPLAISGTGTLYPLNTINIVSADYPSVNGVTPKLRIRAQVYTNDVAPTGTYTFGLHPITRPATSGAAGLCIYTIGTAVTGSNGATFNAPAVDSSNAAVGADFALPADGHYVIGMVQTGTVAASAHLHVSASLQLRNA